MSDAEEAIRDLLAVREVLDEYEEKREDQLLRLMRYRIDAALERWENLGLGFTRGEDEC